MMSGPEPIYMPCEETPLENEALGMCLDPAALALEESQPVNSAELASWERQQVANQEGKLTCGGELADPAAFMEACEASGIGASQCAELFDDEWMASSTSGGPSPGQVVAARAPSSTGASVGVDDGGMPYEDPVQKQRRILRGLNATRAPFNERGIKSKHQWLGEQLERQRSSK
jgi:hypothetical protein